ncbi:MAG: metallophosphoesterase family protein [Treponema sp.]|nr:metallophosphoesterase family protein [Treponema sp.]
MVEIVQQKDFSFGSAERVHALESADSAQVLVISDSHGNKNTFFSILHQFGPTCDALCFCGDGVTDVCSALENSHIQPFLPPVIFFVKGNGDNSTATVLTQNRLVIFVPTDKEAVICGKKILLTHGHKYNVYIGTNELKRFASGKKAAAAFYGHTHVANAQIKNKVLLLNPGSCSLPRGNVPQTFAIVNINKNDEKIDYQYFRLGWSATEEITFTPYEPPKGEVNLFW